MEDREREMPDLDVAIFLVHALGIPRPMAEVIAGQARNRRLDADESEARFWHSIVRRREAIGFNVV